MATIKERARNDGSIGYTAIIRFRKKGMLDQAGGHISIGRMPPIDHYYVPR